MRLFLLVPAGVLCALLACGPGPTTEAPKAPVVIAVGDAGTTTSPPAAHNPSTVVAQPAESEPALAKAPRGKADDGDPFADKPFTLTDAAGDLGGQGTLVATIETSLGNLTCKLYEKKAPITVASFVGLARGTRPWKEPGGGWVSRPAYDGTTFHRIIKGFMIQGGDPKGNGSGEPGFSTPDEAWPGAKHDRAGLLCIANRGANTNGMQFFITDASTPHLDSPNNAYTIFGECAPTSVVHKIASVPTSPGDRPQSPVEIHAIKIARGAVRVP